MRTLYQDFRFGLRLLLKSPGFTAVAVFTLALGIAANTTVFGWIDSLLLHPLPGVAGDDRVVAFGTIPPNGEFRNSSYRDYRDYRDSLKLLSGVAVWTQGVFSVGDAEKPQRIWGELVSREYFPLLGVRPRLGRAFTAEECGDAPGTPPVVIISDRLWRSLFSANPGVVGSTVRVNRRDLTIVGVAPPEFRGGTGGLAFDLWVPLSLGVDLKIINPPTLTSRGSRGLFAIGRLKDGVTIDQARAEVAVAAQRLAAAYPNSNQGMSASLLPLWKSPVGAQTLLQRPLQILMAVCVVVLLIVCANVGNLLLARAVSRQKEFGIRLALGAGRGRLIRQLLTETFLLAGAGAVTGILLSLWMTDSLRWLLPPTDLSVGLAGGLNGRILAFSVLVCGMAAVASGAAPALLSVRSDLSGAINEGGRGGGSGAHAHRMRSLLVVAEIALAAVALAGAGLFARSFRNAGSIHPGFDTNGVMLSQFYLPGYTPGQSKEFCLRLRERLEASPGISTVTFADTAPLGFRGDAGHDVRIDGYVPAPGEYMNFSRTLVPPGYFAAMRIPIVEGRDFSVAEDREGPPAIIVNQTFARRFFGGSTAVGRKVVVSGNYEATVVGVARDIKYRYLSETPQPYFYLPFGRRFQEGRDVFFFLRSSGGADQLASILRREAAALDPEAAIFTTAPLSEYITACLYPQRIASRLLAALGLMALVLAAVGLYSVMTYAVSQRTHEVGIRMALGAQTRDVVAMVMRQGAAMTVAGLAAGIVAALALARLVAAMLVNVSSADPVSFAGAALFLGAVALAASYLPARRATKVDPITALRCQ